MWWYIKVRNCASHSYVKLEFKCNYFQGNCDTITCVKLQNEMGGDTNSHNNQLQFLYLALTYKIILLKFIKFVLKIERAGMSFTFFSIKTKPIHHEMFYHTISLKERKRCTETFCLTIKTCWYIFDDLYLRTVLCVGLVPFNVSILQLEERRTVRLSDWSPRLRLISDTVSVWCFFYLAGPDSLSVLDVISSHLLNKKVFLWVNSSITHPSLALLHGKRGRQGGRGTKIHV